MEPLSPLPSSPLTNNNDLFGGRRRSAVRTELRNQQRNVCLTKELVVIVLLRLNITTAVQEKLYFIFTVTTFDMIHIERY